MPESFFCIDFLLLHKRLVFFFFPILMGQLSGLWIIHYQCNPDELMVLVDDLLISLLSIISYPFLKEIALLCKINEYLFLKHEISSCKDAGGFQKWSGH